MNQHNKFSHTADGRSPGQRITAMGYKWSACGEIIAKGYSTPASVVRGWMNSPSAGPASAVAWRGEARLDLPEFGGELRFRRVRGEGIDPRLLADGELTVRPRSGGERLQTDLRRPRRSLKNLFQENAVPAWEREQLPLLFRGDSLVWAPGLGIAVEFRAMRDATGWVPEWRRRSSR